MKSIQRTLHLRKSILFRYLPYWNEFESGHIIDTMHVENSVFKSTIGFLLNITCKTKDGLNTHKDIQALELEKSYTHKKDRMERFIFLQLATPSQMRRKEQYASIYAGSESPQDSQQT
jgi:hypothetical protein